MLAKGHIAGTQVEVFYKLTSQATSGSRDSKVAIWWEMDILCSQAQLKVIFVVGHATVDEYLQQHMLKHQW